MVRLPQRARPLYPLLKPAYTRLTRALAPVSLALSHLRGGFLPPASVASLTQAAETSGGRSWIARHSETLTRSMPRGVPADHPNLSRLLQEEVPPVIVAELPDGRVLGPHSAVISGRGHLVHDVSLYFGTRRPREHPLYLHPFPGPPKHVPGRVGVLASRGDVNYYHFLIDVLPRLGVLEQCPEVVAPPRWYVPAGTRFQRELLDMVGIGPDARIDSTQVHHIQADELVVPAPPALTVINPPWVVDWLRRQFLTAAQPRPPHRRIYVTRGSDANNRAVVNGAEVESALIARGYELLDPGQMSVLEQIRAFAEATEIVATHGAALVNLAFASPGAVVVELFPNGYVLPDYWKLASGVPGLEYRYLTGVGPAVARSRAEVLIRDITVDLAQLTRVLDPP